MTEREALKLALEALEAHADFGIKSDKAITAIKEALAQPEQEPVAWSYWQSCLNDDGTQTAPWVHRLSKFKPSKSIINKDIEPLYTTPLQRKPLTDEEIDKAWRSCDYTVPWEQHRIDIARAIEAAHGIKGEA